MKQEQEQAENSQPYRTLHSRYLFESRWRSFREDRVDIGEGREITYSYAEVPRAAYVVPLTADGQIALIRQYRYPVRDWVLEVPAGSLQTPQEDPAVRARHELREEVGGECEELIYLSHFYSSSAHITLICEVFLAVGVRLEHAPMLEETELLQRLVLPARQVLQMARDGSISEGQSALAILLAEAQILARENERWVK
jgi:ADP-ribose pyrophosphatase